jgi:putative PIN family toxin of toxin-antitoxin system
MGEKVIFDTNIWVAILFKKELSKSLVPLVEDGSVEVYVSRPLLRELAQVLTYPKVERLILAASLTATTALAAVAGSSTLVKTRGRVNRIREDPPDNRVLECGLDSNARFIISGDRHLLSLKEFKGMKIVKPRDSLDRLPVTVPGC